MTTLPQREQASEIVLYQSEDGRTRIEAHGESKMPVWGELFEKEAMPQKDPTAAATAKVKVIADYVATLQR